MTALITRDELWDAIQTRGVIVVDALGAEYYEQQHLPGAFNLVESEVEAKAPGMFPCLDVPIVTYCSNAACGNSAAVAARLSRLGYSNVRKYREGIQDWIEAGLPVESRAEHAS